MLGHLLVHTAEKAFLSLVFGAVISVALVWPLCVLAQGTSKIVHENSRFDDLWLQHKVANKSDHNRIGLIWFVSILSAFGFGAVAAIILGCFYPRSKRICAAFVALSVVLFAIVDLMLGLGPENSIGNELATLLEFFAVFVPSFVLAVVLRNHERGHSVLIGTCGFVSLCGIFSALYLLVVVPAYFRPGSILIPIIIRTVGHTGVKVLFMAVMFRIAKLFPHANPQAIHVLFIPPIVYMTMIGRLMQVSSNNLLLVVITELILVVFEFSETYGYMRLNAAFALVHDMVDSVLPTAPAQLKVVTRASDSSTTNALELNDQSGAAGERRSSFSLIGHTPLPADTYAYVVNCLAVVEAVTIVICAAFMLLLRANPYSPTDKPVSHERVLVNSAILFFFEAFVTDMFVAWFNVTHEDPVYKVNLMRSWKTRDKRLDFVLFFFLATVGTGVGFFAIGYLCVVRDGNDTILAQCSS